MSTSYDKHVTEEDRLSEKEKEVIGFVGMMLVGPVAALIGICFTHGASWLAWLSIALIQTTFLPLAFFLPKILPASSKAGKALHPMFEVASLVLLALLASWLLSRTHLGEDLRNHGTDAATYLLIGTILANSIAGSFNRRSP